MTTYLVVEIEVTDHDRYKEYQALAQSALKDLGEGGRVIILGGWAGRGLTEPLEGGWNPERFTVVEFPSRDAAHRYYYSQRYQEAVKVRLASSNSKAMFITVDEES